MASRVAQLAATRARLSLLLPRTPPPVPRGAKKRLTSPLYATPAALSLHYNPAYDPVAVAAQFPELAPLGLKDLQLEFDRAREQRLRNRGKKIFVSVVTGRNMPAKKEETAAGGKKKKRR